MTFAVTGISLDRRITLRHQVDGLTKVYLCSADRYSVYFEFASPEQARAAKKTCRAVHVRLAFSRLDDARKQKVNQMMKQHNFQPCFWKGLTSQLDPQISNLVPKDADPKCVLGLSINRLNMDIYNSMLFWIIESHARYMPAASGGYIDSPLLFIGPGGLTSCQDVQKKEGKEVALVKA